MLPLAFPLVFLMACDTTTTRTPDTEAAEPAPPVAKREAKRLAAHGHERIDHYYWLRDREDAQVIDYLKAENRYLEAVMADTAELRETLYREIRGRIKEDDSTAPYRHDDYWYYARYEEGGEYPIYARRRGSMEAPEEVLLDVNALAEGQPFTQVAGLSVSPDHRLLAYAVDHVGRRIYTLRVKNLETGETLDTEIEGVSPGAQWAADNRSLFYTRKDPVTLRSHAVWRHTLGESEDALVFEETDEAYLVYLTKTKSRRYIGIVSSSTLSTEYNLVDAEAPREPPTVFNPRRRDHEYHVDHDPGGFYVYTNLDAKNFRLMKTAPGRTAEAHWEEVVAHRPEVLLENFELFAGRLVLQEKFEGLTRIAVIERASGERREIDFGEAAYSADLGTNYEYDTEWLRYTYESLTTPDSEYDYDMSSGEKVLVKQDEVLGGYDPAQYRSERIAVTARDGARVPVSLVYRRGTPLDGSAPLVQYAYGSYGYSIDPGFSYSRVSLLDRGFIYAIAHVRGGSDLGRAWYEAGKLEHKKNTFTDFVDCSVALVERGYTSPDRLYAWGGSAGGLLMGAIVNMRPDLYHGVVAEVPFVDVITTMLDDSIPLTTGEYDEWGNPNEEAAYRYILSYSPYDNVERRDYPNMLVTTGLHDSQVQYWEPAKWVAKLRHVGHGDNLLLLKTNMEAGHGGASGRFEAIREIALEYAFLLKLEAGRRADR